MRYIKEQHIIEFKAWGGAVSTLDNIINAGKEDELDTLFEEWGENTGRTLTETEINDLLWFESSEIYEALGLNEDGETPCNEEWKLFTETVTDERTQRAIISILKDFNHPYNKPITETELRGLISAHNLRDEVQSLSISAGMTLSLDLIGTVDDITFDFVVENIPDENGNNVWHSRTIVTVHNNLNDIEKDCYILDIIDEANEIFGGIRQ